MKYPAEAIVFEVVSQDASGSDIPIGTHVEVAGPCCVETDRAWKCGVFVLNGYDDEDGYQWTRNLRPLTKAARQMLALSIAARPTDGGAK